jgi:peptidoglycan LD-endopeptidase CwlK
MTAFDPQKTKSMRDKVSIERVEKLHPKIRDEVKELIEKAESKLPATVAIRVVQGLRTFAEQWLLYQQGRTKPGNKVTNAKPGSSFHQYGLSIDFCFVIDKDGNGSFETISWDTLKDADKDGLPDWEEVVRTFEAAGWESGKRWSKFVDAPHLQKTFGYKWKQLLAKHEAKDFIPGTEYVRV